MKTMTCKQLWGACEEKFHAISFNEISELSKTHCMDMLNKWDPDHLKAMEEMKQLMNTPELCSKWFNDKKDEFDELVDNK